MPEAKIINGDTVILISPAQLKFANLKIAKANYCEVQEIYVKDIITNLKSENETLVLLNKKNISKQTHLINSIDLYKSYIERTKQATAYQFKQERKAKRKTVVTVGIVGIILGLIGSIFV